MTAAPLPVQARDPHRYRLARAGIHQVWQYDEQFLFGDGRLLLRGKNGAGKSKALEMLLPFLLDGDSRRLDAAGGAKTTLKWLMLSGWSGGTNRLGYLWLEFVRTTPEGGTERLTLGAAVKASTSTGEARTTYFVTSLEVGEELPLPDPRRRPSLEQLRDLVGPAHCYERATDYRARVARELFGLTDLARYRNLIHLLYNLRRPTIGDKIESGELVTVLGEALPPLDDDVLDKVAHNLDDLDSVREELGRLEQTNAALTTFLTSYRGYLRGVLRARVGSVRDALGDLREKRRAAGTAERVLSELTEKERTAQRQASELDQLRDDADTELRALRDSAAYRALGDLRDRRRLVAAVEATAGSRWTTATIARSAEESAAQRLREESEQIGAELTDLRTGVRDGRRLARACGLDEALVAELPASRTSTLVAAATVVLTDDAGSSHEIVRPAAHTLDDGLPDAVQGWRAALSEAATVTTARRRSATQLLADLGKLAEADARAGLLREHAERLDAEVGEARTRQTARSAAVVEASDTYAADVTSWARRLPDPTRVTALVTLPDDNELPLEERALDRGAAERIADTGHEIAAPILGSYDERRDEILAREGAIRTDLDTARAERSRWERDHDPEPPRSAYSGAVRDPNTGAPLFLLLDFDETFPEQDRPGMEAALEASGLLNAWVCADGTVLAPDTHEILVHPDQPVPGPHLAAALRPVPGHGVSGPALHHLLRCIGLGESTSAPSWISTGGRWQLGALRGAHHKDRAEYIGASVRAATRERRIAELTTRIEDLRASLAEQAAAREEVERGRDRLRGALRDIPNGQNLATAWAAYDAAVEETGRLAAALSTATRDAETAWSAAVSLRSRAQAHATADGLPFGRDLLVQTLGDLGRLLDALRRFDSSAGRIVVRLGTHQANRTSWAQARQKREKAESEYDEARRDLDTARQELHTLETAIGASEQEILAQEAAAAARLTEATRSLPAARHTLSVVHDDRIRAEQERDQALAALAEKEQAVLAGSGRLRRPLGLPGLTAAANLGGLETEVAAFDESQDGSVRSRVKALGDLTDAVESRLGPTRHDVSDSTILGHGERMRDGLSGGYDAEVSEVDGIKRFALHDDTGAHDVAVVGQRIQAAADEARLRLSTREQEVFERYLLGELGDHLARQLLAARNLLHTMNDTLEDVRSSHGIGARLRWELPKDTDADVKAAVGLLDHVSALRSREQSAQLRDVLRRRIEDARQAEPSAGYATHLRVALDYRSWFTFTVMVTDTATPSERRLSHRTALSQGEQRVVAYLVLFAAAAAHFASVARSAPTAPRLILLDDAFAKVDEPTHGRLLGLLVSLDLDFVITSERLWGCFSTVPSLHIYECLRDPLARGVATVHFTWDGKSRRLVGV
ncbi:TIGR02680 family protein [Actinopolymorpha pittospori]|uniref:Uncharacterized protein (TIGR02680 family) n=1 Tax=Actinopolymorpha pittospori TaxID=648752 RepID=A0A927MTI1_9ACTN|nr:TIGR02680 family protein [Actinopolymorpha pittospori]MBE1604543.1 uncharacterized protein (TIGR02680 family) [Actinopolymorpha pittospori]